MPESKQSAAASSTTIDVHRTKSVHKREAGADALCRRLAGDLDNIILTALRKEPARRYASVERMSEDIRRHLEGLPISATKPTWRYRGKKFARRHKMGVAATVLVILAVCGGVAATVREARIAAANARRAEDRFNDVRKLANSLMFEIHDSIEGLPGSTPARRLIVQRSLEYLDRLSQESSGDLSLQRELANAYERIGLVHGDPRGPNLGDIDGARDSFFKALTIRQKVLRSAANPSMTDRLALVSSYREMCDINSTYLGQIGAALDYCRQAVSLGEALYKNLPNDSQIRKELVKDYEVTGLVYGSGGTSGNAGDSYAALENHQKALDLVVQLAHERQEDLDLMAWQGRLSNLTADDLFEIGQVSQAVPLYRRAAATFEDLTRKSNNTRYQDSLVFTYQRMGDMLLVAGHFEESIPFYRKQLAFSEKIADADPKSMSDRTAVVASRATYGHALWRAGHVQEGLESLTRGLAELAESRQKDSVAAGLEAVLRLWMAGALEKKRDISGAMHNYSWVKDFYSRICAADPKDFEDCLSLAGVLDRIARIHIQQGRVDEALAEYQQALAIVEPQSLGPKANLEAVYTAVNVYFGLGEVQAALAAKAASHSREAEQRKQACTWYQKSQSAFQRIPEWLPITPNEYDSRPPKDIKDRLSGCESPADATEVSNTSQ